MQHLTSLLFISTLGDARECEEMQEFSCYANKTGI